MRTAVAAMPCHVDHDYKPNTEFTFVETPSHWSLDILLMCISIDCGMKKKSGSHISSMWMLRYYESPMKQTFVERTNERIWWRPPFSTQNQRIVCDFFSLHSSYCRKKKGIEREKKQKKNWKTFSNTNEHHHSWFEWRVILLVM